MVRARLAISWFAFALAMVGGGRVAFAEDLSILQGLYGYWSFEPPRASVSWGGKIRDDGTLLHAGDPQYPANADQGKDLPPERVPGIRGLALRLQGKKRPFVMQVPLADGSPRRLTISLWAWMDERRDDATLFSNTALSNFGYGQFRFKVLDDGIRVIFGEFNPRDDNDDLGPSEVMATGIPFPLKQWAHVALVIDEPNARLYLDGRLIGQIRLARPLQMSVIQTVAFGACRGRWADNIEQQSRFRDQFEPWAGRIDEVAMWTRPLSAAELRGVHAATLAGQPVYDAQPILTFWESSLFQAILAGLAVICFGLLVHRAFTRRLRRRLTAAESLLLVDAERKRIADDIHDELGARLAKVSLLSELAAHDVNGAPDRLRRVSDSARDAARSLDELVWTLKPGHDSLEQVTSYLTDAASELLEHTGIALRLKIPDNLPALAVPPTVRRELLLAWKESLANAMKHAHPTEIVIIVAVEGVELTVTIADNGVGMPESDDLDKRRSLGNGLRTMCERIERLGGRCKIRDRASGGTEVIFTLKLG